MKYLRTLLLPALWLVLGCPQDNSDPPQDNIRVLWSSGSKPAPSPTDDRVLFLQEEAPAGLYVLNAGSAIHLNPGGPQVRSDYTWSADGQRISFSGPGQPGGTDAGIWISADANLTTFTRIWDRGSQPRFVPAAANVLVCAGPEDGSADQGIWLMDYAGSSRQRLSETGVEPEVSPDGSRIAYVIAAGSSGGRTMVVYNRLSFTRDTVAVSVVKHAWLSDSQSLVYETVQNGNQQINVVRLGDDLLGVTIASGTSPSAMRAGNGMLFTGISGDRLNGIYRASVGSGAQRVSPVGTHAREAGANRIVAQDSTVLIEITF